MDPTLFSCCGATLLRLHASDMQLFCATAQAGGLFKHFKPLLKRLQHCSPLPCSWPDLHVLCGTAWLLLSAELSEAVSSKYYPLCLDQVVAAS